MDDMFNIVKMGYDPVEVKKYIGELEPVVISYKEREAAIRNAVISAQLAADNIVKKAEAEAEEIKAQAVRVLDEALKATAAQRESIDSYRQDYEALIKKYTRRFEEEDALRFFSGANEVERGINEIKSSVLEKLRNNKNNE